MYNPLSGLKLFLCLPLLLIKSNTTQRIFPELFSKNSSEKASVRGGEGLCLETCEKEGLGVRLPSPSSALGPSRGCIVAPVCSEPGQTLQTKYSHVRTTPFTVEKRKCAQGGGLLTKHPHLPLPCPPPPWPSRAAPPSSHPDVFGCKRN